MQQISSHPVQMQDIYGKIKETTRTALHKQDIHPVAHYSSYVKNNSTAVHTYKSCGPFPAVIHDWGHAFWMNLLTKEQREVALFQFTSILESIRETTIKYRKDNAAQRLDLAIDEAADFNLTPLADYMRPNIFLTVNQQKEYLARTFGINRHALYLPLHCVDHKIGQPHEDDIFLSS